jgi:hypothetical protein
VRVKGAISVVPAEHARPEGDKKVVMYQAYKVKCVYDRRKDRLKFLRCRRDPKVDRWNKQRRDVAQFTRKYLTGMEKFRESVRVEDGKYEYSAEEDTKIEGLDDLWYRSVGESDEKWKGHRIWLVDTNIYMDHYLMKFGCRVIRDDEGQLRVISDTLDSPTIR